jgi:hypothetical protein
MPPPGRFDLKVVAVLPPAMTWFGLTAMLMSLGENEVETLTVCVPELVNVMVELVLEIARVLVLSERTAPLRVHVIGVTSWVVPSMVADRLAA